MFGLHAFRQSLAATTALVVAAGVCPFDAWADDLEPVPSYENFAGPLAEQYCFDCHSGDEPDAGLALHRIEGGEQFQADRADWTKVLARLRAGEMPPPDYDAPTDEERAKWVSWIEARLAELDCSGPHDPGWVTLRRLNRHQYQNTIRDLLEVEYQPADSFPPDELAFGFDNNADMLSLTPRLMEKYLAAARDISRAAVLTPESLTEGWVSVPKDRWQGGQHDHEDARDLSIEGAIEFAYDLPRAGRYAMRVTVSASQGGDEPVRMALLDGGQAVQVVSVHATFEEIETFTVALDLPAGRRRLGVAFLNDYYADGEDRNLYVRKFEIVPLDDAERTAPPAHLKWLTDGPSPADWRDDQRWRGKVQAKLTAFANRAYRRQAPAAEIDRLMSLVDARRRTGDTYERAMQIALQAMLVSPRFLFIGNLDEIPRERAGDAKGYPVDDYELAARLSYFLWSSMPDAQLLAMAEAGGLRSRLPDVVSSMIKDQRSDQFINNFSGQWLGTRQLGELEPDEAQFGKFDAALRSAMAREAEMVFGEVVRSNLPVTALLNADFTYLNHRLAKHYGIEGVRGKFFRRVAFADVPEFVGVRGGVLTMAGVLATTSNPDRTSPVKRGKWVLGELLGAEPPPPPPGIEGLEDVARRHDRQLSIREQMELHRADPSCAVCHKQMDAMGLALENFDAVGRWRDNDATGPVDATGQLPTGEKMDGAADLRQVLLARRDAFRQCLAKKMLTYALGRGLEYYDECAIRQIVERVEAEGDRMQGLITAIVESTPFQERRWGGE